VDSSAQEKTLDRSLVRVTIFQQPYTLRSSGEPGETESLAKAVDDLMHQIAARLSSTDPTRVAVLTSLHLADRARALQSELDSLRDRLSSLDSRLGSLIPLEDHPED